MTHLDRVQKQKEREVAEVKTNLSGNDRLVFNLYPKDKCSKFFDYLIDDFGDEYEQCFFSPSPYSDTFKRIFQMKKVLDFKKTFLKIQHFFESYFKCFFSERNI